MKVLPKPPSASEMRQVVVESQLWKAIFRHGYPDDPPNRALVIMSNVFLHLHPVKVKKHAAKFTWTYGLGGISFYLFLLLTVTGVYLMFFYTPSADLAYPSIKAINSEVTFGLLTRNMHRWAAHLMIITVCLHMVRVFYQGGYKPPREFNWMIGVALLLATLLLSFTGYLLPWDQLAFWAITVGTNMAGYAPLVGFQAHTLLLGGTSVGPNALLRFYVLHVIFLPLLLGVGLAIHFWRVRKDGGISGPIPDVMVDLELERPEYWRKEPQDTFISG